jgi:hypothetical protein
MNGKKIIGKVFYGLHMYPGVAQYDEKGKAPKMVFIGEDTIKHMNSTFPGKPVFVFHVKDVDPETMEEDGWVSESFFNKADGKNWVKFLVTTQQGLEAVRKGWKLSNAYFAKSSSGGGTCNGVEYQEEVMEGEYEHLAIVPNPRYEESVILTPDEFKAYNAKKELELSKLTNSADDNPKGEGSVMFFKKTKVENSAELEGMMITLEKSKKDVTVKEAISLADKFSNMNGYAADDHMVKCNDDEEMSVSDLRDSYNSMKNSEKERLEKEAAAKLENEEEEEDPAEGEAGAAEADKGRGTKKNAADKGKKAPKDKAATEAARVAAAKETEVSDKYFNELEGAEAEVKPIKFENDVEMSTTKVQRGKSRYGSGE